MKKRILSTILCCALLLTLMPVVAMASGTAASVTVENIDGTPKFTVHLDAADPSIVDIAATVFTKAQHDTFTDDYGSYVGYQHIVDNTVECVLNSNTFQIPENTQEYSFSLPSLTANTEYVVYAYGTGSAGSIHSTNFETDNSGKIAMPQCVITWDNNTGDTAADPASSSFDQGGEITLPTTAPTKAGYKFNGWFDATTGGSQISGGATAPAQAAVTYYAQWTEKGMPTNPTVSAVTYHNGLILADVSLPKTDSNKVTWTWDDDTAQLTVETKNYSASAVETDDYKKADAQNVSVEVTQGAVTIGGTLSGQTVASGTALSSVNIATLGITAKDAGASSYTVPGTFAWDNSSDTVTEGNLAKAFTFTPTNGTLYAAPANGSYTFTLAGTNDMTATTPNAALQYGDTFTVTAAKGTGNDQVLVFPATGTNCTKVSESGLTATYRVTAHSSTASVTVTQAASADGSVGAGSATATTGALSARVLTFTGTITADERAYDGTTDADIIADVTAFTITNKVGSDVVSLTGTITGDFAAATAGTNTVTLTTSGVSLTGADAAHYTLTGATWPTATGGTITKADLAWTNALGFTASKVYDGTPGTAAAVAFTSTTIAGANSENITVTLKSDQTATLGGSNVGTAHTFTVTPAMCDFTDGTGDMDNYNAPATDLSYSNGVITARPITIVAADSASAYTSDSTIALSKLIKLDTSFALGAGDTIDSIFGSISNTEIGTGTPIVNAEGVLVTIQNADPANVTALPLTAGAYTYTVNVTGLVNGNYTVTNNVATPTLTVTTPPAPPSGGGGVSSYTVTYDVGEHGALAEGAAKTEKVNHNKVPNAPAIVAAAGYKFMGWSVDGKTVLDMTKEKVTKAVTYKAVYAAYDHKPYMVGIGEGVFAPTGTLTRAEAVTMLARLTPGFAEGTAYTNDFIDAQDGWYTGYIGFAAANGIAFGVGDGLFQPMRTITRGEFAAMLARFMGLEPATDLSACPFSDCAGHWTEGYILALHQAGVMDGLADGTVQPDRSITREEAAKMVNVAIGRTPSKEQMDKTISEYTNPYGDVSVDLWSFYHIMEASVKHVSSDFHGEN